jgi:bifunctional DNA-binding transcriptional regulator/antitoxin component of YhaV-PrlF toxin-antitoxin module
MRKVKRKRRRGYTRLSSKHQVTIPIAVLAESGLAAGDELKVEAEAGRIVLSPADGVRERRLAAIERGAGSLTGAYPPGYLDDLRGEWR